MPSELEISLLGGVSLTLHGAPLEFTNYKEAALFIYLVCTGRPHTLDELAELLWSEAGARQAATNLRDALARLRASLGPFLSITDDEVAFRSEEGRYSLDVADFAARLAAVQPWRGRMEWLPRVAAEKLIYALRLYRGDFMAGFNLRDAGRFGDWLDAERERLRSQAAEGLQQLLAFYLRRGRYGEAIESASRLLELDPLDEESHRQMMLLLASSGRRGAALAQYKACERILAQELGVDPTPVTQALYSRIRAGATADLTVGAFQPRSAAHNLPLQMTPLVGRREELGLLRQRLLNPSSRLVTLAGVGGVGKTRLALAAAEELMGDFAHGAWFVPLAGAGTRKDGGRGAETLVQAVARALDLTFSPGNEPRAQLLDYLRRKELLLVLDNLEEMLEAGSAFINDLLRSAPYITVLATCRQRLNLEAEQVMRVEGLPVPPPGADPYAGWDGAGPYPYSSVQLFVERAARVRAEFKLDRSNLPDVVRICRLAEGLPLAIELAASWAEEMDCAAIAQSIQGNLDFLTTAKRDVPERHRSMRAVLESSWELLAPAEQSALAQMSIFYGEFSQEAALAVTGATAGSLEALEERSLLRYVAPARYEMHTLLRYFAGEKIGVLFFGPPPGVLPTRFSKAEMDLRSRHSAYYLDLLARREGALYGSEPRKAMDEILQEVENVTQAWRWAVEQGQVELVARGSVALSRFLRLSGLFREGYDLFEKAVAHLRMFVQSAAAPDWALEGALGRALAEQAGFAIALAQNSEAAELAQQGVELARHSQNADVEATGCMIWGSALLLLGEYPAAREQLQRALDVAAQTGFRWLQAETLRRLGVVERDMGDHAPARALFERARGLFAEIGDRDGAGTVLDNLGIVAGDQNDYPGARAYYEQALAIFQETNYRLGQVSVLTNLGCLFSYLGDYAGAQVHFERAWFTLQETGGRLGEALLLNNLGNTAYLQGNHGAAYEYAQQALRIAQESGERTTQGYALDLLGHVLAAQGRLEGAAASYREALGLWGEVGQAHVALESLAGLARVALAEGDLAQARQHVGRILAYIDGAGPILGTDEDFVIYLTCYQVLQACQEARAREILATAYHLLQERAAMIPDEQSRHSFLENVVANREIAQQFEGGSQLDSTSG